MSTRIDATAPPAELKLGGKVFQFSPMTDEDIAYLDQWVQQRHIRIARQSLGDDATDEQRDRTERIALEQASTMSFMSGTGARIISTIDGWSQIMFCGIRKNHPGVTSKDIRDLLLDPENLDKLQDEWELLNLRQGTRAKDGIKKKRKKARKTARASRKKNR